MMKKKRERLQRRVRNELFSIAEEEFKADEENEFEADECEEDDVSWYCARIVLA